MRLDFFAGACVVLLRGLPLVRHLRISTWIFHRSYEFIRGLKHLMIRMIRMIGWSRGTRKLRRPPNFQDHFGRHQWTAYEQHNFMFHMPWYTSLITPSLHRAQESYSSCNSAQGWRRGATRCPTCGISWIWFESDVGSHQCAREASRKGQTRFSMIFFSFSCSGLQW